jgi:hypothetical protein
MLWTQMKKYLFKSLLLILLESLDHMVILFNFGGKNHHVWQIFKAIDFGRGKCFWRTQARLGKLSSDTMRICTSSHCTAELYSFGAQLCLRQFFSKALKVQFKRHFLPSLLTLQAGSPHPGLPWPGVCCAFFHLAQMCLSCSCKPLGGRARTSLSSLCICSDLHNPKVLHWHLLEDFWDAMRQLQVPRFPQPSVCCIWTLPIWAAAVPHSHCQLVFLTSRSTGHGWHSLCSAFSLALSYLSGHCSSWWALPLYTSLPHLMSSIHPSC